MQRWRQGQLWRRKKSKLMQPKISDRMVRFCRKQGHIKFKYICFFLGPKEARIKGIIRTNNIAVRTNCIICMSCWESEPLLRDSEIDSALWIGPERLNSHLCRKAWRGDGGEISRLSRSTVIVACHRRNLPLKLCGLTRVSHAAAHSEMANEQRSLLSSRSVAAEHVTAMCLSASSSVSWNVSLVSRL